MPRILVTNDDGIQHAGIRAVEEALAAVGEVYTVAPAREMSGASQSISLRRAVAFEEVAPRRWAVDGTPADCVILALHRILGFLPDLVVSGINPGGNLGRNVHYSGTVAAAIEGSLHGIPSMAVSRCLPPPFDFVPAAALTAQLASHLLGEELAEAVALNVNIPNVAAGVVPGIRMTRMGYSAAEHLPAKGMSVHPPEVADRVKPSEPESPADHRLTSHGATWRPVFAPDADYTAVRDGFISITPLVLDRSSEAGREVLETWLKTFQSLSRA